MKPPSDSSTILEYRDPFAHLLMPKLYTPICICYSMTGKSSKAAIVEKLIEALKKLSANFPWLAGQVISDYLPGNDIRLVKVTSFKQSCCLIVRDHTENPVFPSMEQLKKANFPSSILDGTLLSPLNGPPTSRDGDSVPVFFLQANFINGGLVLNIAGEHSTMDGQGLGQVMQLLSKACYNDPFTEEELFQGNCTRDNIIPLLEEENYEPGPELDGLIKIPTSTPLATQNVDAPSCAWAYFRFRPSSLSQLKSIASSSIRVTESSRSFYITTNDALSAFIWQSTSRIRARRLPADTLCTFARAVDVRSSLAIPSSYIGNMSNHTYHTLALSSICSASLGLLSSSLRAALEPRDLGFTMRSLATHIFKASDKSNISYGANMNLSKDIFLSSWTKLPCYNLDFNLGLGFPESVRRARYATIEGLMYLMPMGREGEIDAAICLRVEDLDNLKADEEFKQYATWIG